MTHDKSLAPSTCTDVFVVPIRNKESANMFIWLRQANAEGRKNGTQSKVCTNIGWVGLECYMTMFKWLKVYNVLTSINRK